MSCIRTIHNRENPYVQLNRKAIQDNKMSLRARGLLAYCLSHPDGWTFYVKKLVQDLKEGRNVIYDIIKELIENDYALRITTVLNKNGKKGNASIAGSRQEYLFFEFRLSQEEKDLYIKCERDPVFGDSETRDVEKQQLLKDSEELLDKDIIASKTQLPAGGNNNPPTKKKEKKPLYPCLQTETEWTDYQKRLLMKYPEEEVGVALAYVNHESVEVQGGALGKLKYIQHILANPEQYVEQIANVGKPKKTKKQQKAEDDEREREEFHRKCKENAKQVREVIEMGEFDQYDCKIEVAPDERNVIILAKIPGRKLPDVILNCSLADDDVFEKIALALERIPKKKEKTPP